MHNGYIKFRITRIADLNFNELRDNGIDLHESNEHLLLASILHSER